MAKTRSEYYTRTRLLNQLGLFQEPLPKISALPGASLSAATTATTRSVVEGSCSSVNVECPTHPAWHGSMVPFEMKLNDSWQEHSSLGRSSCHSSVTSDSIETCEQQQQQHIHFKDTVSVISIPSRYQYSDRIKQSIWSNRIELREMAQRNMIEFESEGFDWRNVVLEEDMYIDASDGHYVHPCHVNKSLYYPKLSSMRPVPVVGPPSGSLQDVLEKQEEEEDEEAEDDHFHFAPLRRLDARVIA